MAFTKRAQFKAIIRNPPAKKIEKLGASLLELEEHMKRDDDMAGRPLDEDI